MTKTQEEEYESQEKLRKWFQATFITKERVKEAIEKLQEPEKSLMKLELNIK